VSEKRVLLREAARRDLETAVDYYAKVAGSGVALGFIDALQSAIGSLPSAHPWGRLAIRGNSAFPACAACQ
jgi:toxin ParE1/3/4